MFLTFSTRERFYILKIPLVVVLLSFVEWQPRMSNGMLIQLNLVVVFVMAQYFNAMIHEVVVWHIDTPLLSSVKEQTTRISDTGLGA